MHQRSCLSFRALEWDGALPASPLAVFAAHPSVMDGFLHQAVSEALRPLLAHPQVWASNHLPCCWLVVGVSQQLCS